MHLRNLSDDELLAQTKTAVLKERDTTLGVLHHLREVERRQLFAPSHSSHFDYCVHALGYDAGSAQLRISAMRLLRDLPELEQKVESGGLNLTLLAQAQSFFRKEAISLPTKKREILSVIEGKSTREAQRALMGRAMEPEKHLPEKVRPISKTHSELRLVVDESLLEKLKDLQALLAHAHPGASLKDVIEIAVTQAIQNKLSKEPKRPRTEPPSLHAHDGMAQQPKKAQPSEAEIRRIVWRRDQGRCGYVVDLKTGRKCETRYALEYDHIQARALGGVTTAENLRLRCRIHNRLEATRSFGADKMATYVPAMR